MGGGKDARKEKDVEEEEEVVRTPVLLPSPRPEDAALIPNGYFDLLVDVETGEPTQEAMEIMAFLLKKDVLRQDSFLIGPPGRSKRLLAMAYCEMSRRPVEYLCISQDTTVSDIKQRREIVDHTTIFVDSPAVRAAIHGRVLVLEGVEKAERNVLSVINNLLENREIQLEDGRFLTAPERFDDLARRNLISAGNNRENLVSCVGD